MKQKYKLSELFGIKAAYDRLTNYQKIVGDKAVITPFVFSGKTRWIIAKNINKIQDTLKPWDKIIQTLKEKYCIVSSTKETDEQFLAMNEEAAKISNEQQEELELSKIPLNELIDDRNPVSADVLGVLDKFELLEVKEEQI